VEFACEELGLEVMHKPNNNFICDCTVSQDDESDDGAVDGIGDGIDSENVIFAVVGSVLDRDMIEL
jgi:hypothetical protein